MAGENEKKETSKKEGLTSVSDYRNRIAGQETTVTLPSSAVFKIKRLSVMDYLKEGLTDIPNDYFQFVNELGQGKVKADSEEAKKNYELFEEFLRITIEKGVISPPMVLTYNKDKVDTHLLFSEMTQEDQQALVGYISGKV